MIHELHALRKDVDELKRASLSLEVQEALAKKLDSKFAALTQRIEALEAKRTPGRPKKDE